MGVSTVVWTEFGSRVAFQMGDLLSFKDHKRWNYERCSCCAIQLKWMVIKDCQAPKMTKTTIKVVQLWLMFYYPSLLQPFDHSVRKRWLKCPECPFLHECKSICLSFWERLFVLTMLTTVWLIKIISLWKKQSLDKPHNKKPTQGSYK